MLSQERKLLHAVGGLYEAGLDSAAWQSGINHLLEAIGSRFLLISDLDPATAPIDQTSLFGNHSDRLILGLQEHRDEMSSLDPTIRLLQTSTGRSSFQFARDAIRGVDERYYEWHLDRCGTQDWLAFFAPARNDQRFGASFHYDREITSKESAVLSIAFEHLERAHRLATASKSFGSLTSAAALLGPGATIASLNEKAKDLANGANPIIIQNSFLLPEERSLRAPWIAQIDKLLAGASGEPKVAALMLTKPEHALPLIAKLELVPTLFGSSPRHVVATFRNLAQAENAAVTWSAFKFTPAETRLATVILDPECSNIRDAAEISNISYATARTQLNALFSKTGTQSQSQLVRILQASRFE